MTLECIRALALDVDGVLTDGGVWWGPQGEEWKRFHFADIMGVSLAGKAGLVVTLISGEDSPLVDRFAAKMGLAGIAKGCKDKAAALGDFAARHGLGLDKFGFIGDDVNDLGVIAGGLVGRPCQCPSFGQGAGRFRHRAVGGNGAVREAIDRLLAARTAASSTFPA